MRSVALGIVVLFLAVGLAVVPSATAACAINHQSVIRVATLSPQPPAFSSPTLHGITVYFWGGIFPGAKFELTAVAGSSCQGSICNPDFNVIFQKPGSGMFDTQVGPTYNSAGMDSGTVPGSAQWALIWMRHGPDVPNGDGDIAFARFNFGQFC